MLLYNHLTIFENIVRTMYLQNFHEDVKEYFENISKTDNVILGIIVDENEIAKKLRSKINIKIYKATSHIKSTNINMKMQYLMPDKSTGELHLLASVFNLSSLRVDPAFLFDHIEMSIGAYECDKWNSLGRTLNPFYWLGRIVKLLIGSFFNLFGMLGLNQTNIENSSLGKAFKIIFSLLSYFITLHTVLDKIGLLESSKQMIKFLIENIKTASLTGC